MASTEFPHSKKQAAAQVAKLKAAAAAAAKKKAAPKPKAKASGGQMGGAQMAKPRKSPKGRKA
jgi:hypothetical protein|tara:strand:+ start:2911 stop:3099 length:189 start_codon:yes stop_codon:yes gene_type:complete